MFGAMDLKQIERKTFRSTFQDGLYDIFMGCVTASMAVYVYRPESGFSPQNIIAFVLIYSVFSGMYWLGKKYITLPRMGQVKFGEIRKQKGKTLAIILGIIVLLQIGLVILTATGWLSTVLGERLFAGQFNERLTVAAVGFLFVGIPLSVMAYLNDFPRGFYIAMMMALAVFMMILTNQPVYPLVLGGLILVPGLVLFYIFLKKYPIHHEGEAHG